VRRGPDVEADAGFMEGSRDRLNLVVWSGVKQSLFADMNGRMLKITKNTCALAIDCMSNDNIPYINFAFDAGSRLVKFETPYGKTDSDSSCRVD
jgi:hypothetical protein